jgi:hypothetical protein
MGLLSRLKMKSLYFLQDFWSGQVIIDAEREEEAQGRRISGMEDLEVVDNDGN